MQNRVPKLAMLNALLLLAITAGCSDAGLVDPLVTRTVKPSEALALEVVSGANQSGAPGQTLAQPLVVRVRDGAGNAVAGREVRFQVLSGGGAVATQSPLSDSAGLATATWTLGPGEGAQQIEASVLSTESGSPAASAILSAAAGSRPVPSVTVDLQIVRMDGGDGPAVVSSGIPLPPGLLTPSGLGNVALTVNGQEQPIHVEALGGIRKDGSLRSILMQFNYSVGAQPIPAQLLIGPNVTRASADLPKFPTDYNSTKPVPQAAVLPTSTAYLASIDLVGPSVPAPDAFNGQYENTFITQSDGRWAVDLPLFTSWTAGDNFIGWNFYDRALTHYVWWVRTGNPEYWRRAAYYLVGYRDYYVTPNQGRIQPWYMSPEGLALHYLLTGDEASRTGLAGMGDSFAGYAAGGWWNIIGNNNDSSNDARAQSKFLLVTTSAWMVAAPSQMGVDWANAARRALSLILGTQSADGAYRFAVVCGGQLNYMTGLLNTALEKYYDGFESDSRIPAAVKDAVDFLWNTQWVGSAGGFQYATQVCPNIGDTTPSPDLDLLMVEGFGWVYRQTGTASYRAAGDTVFNEGVAKAWLGNTYQQGDKQFNENYYSSHRYLFFRR